MKSSKQNEPFTYAFYMRRSTHLRFSQLPDWWLNSTLWIILAKVSELWEELSVSIVRVVSLPALFENLMNNPLNQPISTCLLTHTRGQIHTQLKARTHTHRHALSLTKRWSSSKWLLHYWVWVGQAAYLCPDVNGIRCFLSLQTHSC